ncbi:MAG: nitrile hydratase accessory protein [Steroidobacteraceae bacterium]
MNEGPTLQLPGLPLDEEGPVFKEPWEARVFAMVLRLHQRGLFTWTEWADALAHEIRAAREAGDADLGDTYYHHWLRALEAMAARKGATSDDELARCHRAWAEAAMRTPHGHAVELCASENPVKAPATP